ncbi:hypothetical protein FHS57_003839 [Runella defluvii]|uniref:DUF6916 domain-containing protein n=1 Tax=Runella defluvii TaxID=370973 RepID=A0A7W5ZN02_9BACT|nr:hypothetical protein [Runella defluvii]MBB3839828.1 hypothetical protein [Runella defluvii]
MIDTLQITDFQPYLNQDFTIHFASEASHPAQLTRVSAWSTGVGNYRQPFTLEFETDMTRQYYLQGTFTLTHPTAGDVQLFMVPIGPGAKGMRYEVVFS